MYNNYSIISADKTDYDLELARQKRATKAAKKDAKTKNKIAKQRKAQEHAKLVAEARSVLDKDPRFSAVKVSNTRPAPGPNYDFARVNGGYVAVPVTKKGNVPVRVVRQTEAARSPAALRRDMAGRPNQVRYDPYKMTPQQYVSHARYPGRSDIVGLDCSSRCKPTVPSRNAKPAVKVAPYYQTYKPRGNQRTVTLTDRQGLNYKVPVTKDGFTDRRYLQAVQSSRSVNAIRADAATSAKRVISPIGTPYQMRAWITDPGSIDIKGIDSAKGAKINYIYPRSPEEAKAFRQANGRKGGMATAAKKKAAASKKKSTSTPKKTVKAGSEKKKSTGARKSTASSARKSTASSNRKPAAKKTVKR